MHCSQRGKVIRFVKMRKGVLQGEPSGPTMFVAGNHEFGRAVTAAKSPGDVAQVSAELEEPIRELVATREVNLHRLLTLLIMLNSRWLRHRTT